MIIAAAITLWIKSKKEEARREAERAEKADVLAKQASEQRKLEQEDRRRELTRKWGRETVEHLMEGHIWINMTEEQLTHSWSWGRPDQDCIEHDFTVRSVKETWKYNQVGKNRFENRIFLKDGRVVSGKGRRVAGKLVDFQTDADDDDTKDEDSDVIDDYALNDDFDSDEEIADDAIEYKIGTRVNALWAEEEKYYPGTVIGIRGKGSATRYRIEFDDGVKVTLSKFGLRFLSSDRDKSAPKKETPGANDQFNDDMFDDRYDLLWQQTLHPTKAKAGTVMTVILPNKRSHLQPIPAGTRNGYRFCIKGQSQIRRPDGKTGNLWIELEIAEFKTT
jgi:hypothetical protein